MSKRNEYKRSYEEKINALEKDLLNLPNVNRRLKLYQVLALCGILILGMLGFTIQIVNSNTELDRGGLIVFWGIGVWLILYVCARELYIWKQQKPLLMLFIILGYIGLIFGGMALGFMVLLELFSKKYNLYLIYKNVLIVLMASYYVMFVILITWEILTSDIVTGSYLNTIWDWYFGLWVLIFLEAYIVFYLALKFFLKNENDKIEKLIIEMRIVCYSILVITMIYIWGKGNVDEIKQGFLNAATVWLLLGTIKNDVADKHRG